MKHLKLKQAKTLWKLSEHKTKTMIQNIPHLSSHVTWYCFLCELSLCHLSLKCNEIIIMKIIKQTIKEENKQRDLEKL